MALPTRPSSALSLEWATVSPPAGATFSLGQAQAGHQPNEQPPCQWENDWKNRGYQWAQGWLDPVVRRLVACNWFNRGTTVGGNIVPQYGSAYLNGLYLLGAAAGSLSTSLDGSIWAARTSNFAGNGVNAFAYGAGVWVAVGGGGSISSSSDGITWTARTSNFAGNSVTSVVFANNLFVAVGASGKISTSTDGITWTARTSGTGTTFLQVIYGNGLYVAFNGGVFTSPDGTTWTSQTISTNARCGAYSGSLFVAGGNTGGLSTSPDGVTWTSRTSNFGANTIQTVAYNSGLGVWAVGGNAGTIISSPDGTTWTARTNPAGGSETVWNIGVGLDVFVAAIGQDTVSGRIATSVDGTVWIERPTGAPATSSFRTVAFSGGNFISASYAGDVIQSLSFL